MPLTSNVYHVGRGIDTISWHDRRDHASSRIDSHEPYPALRTLVECLEGVSRDANELDEWYHSDSLFRFAITAHSDRIVQMGRLERDVVLNCILSMGIYNWKDTDKQGGGSCPVMSIQYAAVTGDRGGITQGVNFEFFESFLLIYSHNTHWINFEFFQRLLTTLIKTYSQGNFRN